MENNVHMLISSSETKQAIWQTLIHRNKYKRRIDERNDKGILIDLNELIGKASDVGEKALLHSMLAELYVDYYAEHSYVIEGRTNLADTVPADMEQWSANIFIDKIIKHLELSIKNAARLKRRTTQKYDDIILLGADKGWKIMFTC